MAEPELWLGTAVEEPEIGDLGMSSRAGVGSAVTAMASSARKLGKSAITTAAAVPAIQREGPLRPSPKWLRPSTLSECVR
ncbi:hypothetical protein GCM10010404_88640 [Nonomuraea africana]